jgi:hypothetical protein
MFRFAVNLIFPPDEPSDTEYRKMNAKWHRELIDARNAKVEGILQHLPNLSDKEKSARRRWERLIEDSKREINEWDWDAQFAEIEDTGDREALYLAIFEMATKEPRLRRERFHREALERTKRVSKDLPPVEKREFLAKEVAIATAHGHIGDQHFADVIKGIDGETMIARDKVYKTLVQEFCIPHLEKFKKIVQDRDDWSLVEQTRWYWQPKEQLVAKIDSLLALCKLERNFQPEEKAEWIYELYMAPKFYPEMERREGAALEYVYWTQGPDCVPQGYESPDEKRWKLEEEYLKMANEAIGDVKKSLSEDEHYGGSGAVGVSGAKI